MPWYWWTLIVSGALMILVGLAFEWGRQLLWLLFNVAGFILDWIV